MQKITFTGLCAGFQRAIMGAGRQYQRHRREPGGQQNAIHTAKNPQAIALLPKDYHFAVPGKFTVAVAALNSPPLTVFSMTTKPCSAAKWISPVWCRQPGLELNVVPTSWEALGVTSGKYDAAISNITVTKERKEKFDFATYRKDSLGFYVKVPAR
jgi:polar amino acid transport system substrate-binding protein